MSQANNQPSVGKAPSGHFEWLDYLRFASALAVLLFHYLANGIRRNKIEAYDRLPLFSDLAEYGHLGVDVFFIISGFVILRSARDGNHGRFLVSRFVRLWPTFFICLTITTLVINHFGEGAWSVSAWRWLVNFSMVSAYVGVPYVDGVYWTLAFEIVFYAAVYLALLAFSRIHLWMIHAWLAGLAVGLAIETAYGTRVPLINGYHALFALGCTLSLNSKDTQSRLHLGALRILALGLALWGAAIRTQAISLHRGYELSIFVVFAILLATTLVFLLLSDKPKLSFRLPFARTAGLMTYPIYLVHANIGYILLNSLTPAIGFGASFSLVIAAILLLSWLVVVAWETPTKPAWTKAASWAYAQVSSRFRAATAPGT